VRFRKEQDLGCRIQDPVFIGVRKDKKLIAGPVVQHRVNKSSDK